MSDYVTQDDSYDCEHDYSASPLTFALLRNESNTTTYASLSYDGTGISSSTSVELSPGVYKLTVQRDDCKYFNYTATIDYTKQKYYPSLTSLGGGLRIEEIADDARTIKFDYSCKDGITSGLLLSEPEYITLYFQGDCDENGPVYDLSTDLFSLIGCRSSNSIKPIIANNGSSVGYSRVSKIEIDQNNDSIVTTYYFKNEPEQYRSYKLPDLPNIAVLSNGLKEKIEYKNNSEIVKKDTFLYSEDNSRTYTHYACRQDMARNLFIFYKNSNAWWKMDQKITTNYHDDGETILAEAFEYNTDNFLLSKTTFTNSSGNEVETDYYYPDHYSGIAVYDTMVNRHIVSPVIEKKEYNNMTLIKTLKTNYNLWGTGLLVHPASVQKAYGSSSLINQVTYKSYDMKGNILNHETKDGITTTYTWDTNGIYPLSKETSSGTDSLTESYTWRSLVGLLTITDTNGTTTYYEYDSFGRLSAIKNDDGDLLKKYEYHYE